MADISIPKTIPSRLCRVLTIVGLLTLAAISPSLLIFGNLFTN